MNVRWFILPLVMQLSTVVADTVIPGTSPPLIPGTSPSLIPETSLPFQAAHYYLKTANQEGGNSEKKDFNGPYFKHFPWPAPAVKPLRFALFIPQTEDTWKSFSYAAQRAADRLNVQLSIYSAKGYVNLGRQIKQLQQFGPLYDGVIISAIDSYKMDKVLVELGKQVPIVAYGNEVYSNGVRGKAVTFFTDLGARLGRFLVKHIKKLSISRPVKIAFVMGPKGAAWSDDMKNGVLSALNEDANMQDRFQIVLSKHGHTKKRMQEKLVRLVLDQQQELDILVGTAPAIERAAAIRDQYKKRHPNLELAATYFNADLYSAVFQEKVLAVGWDDIPDTGRLAVSMLLNLTRNAKYPALRAIISPIA